MPRSRESTFIGVLGIVTNLVLAAAAADSGVTLENGHFQYRIGADGRNLAFIDRRTGVDYLRPGGSPCAWVRQGGREIPAGSVTLAEGRLTLGFAEAGAEVVLRVESRPSYLRLGVESVTGEGIDSVVFLNLPLTLLGRPAEPFGACAYSLNLHTRVDALPALQSQLRAAGERKFGILGAKAALVGVPMAALLPALKEVLTEADEMPLCRVAGPWAREIPFNHGSYLFNFGSLVETNVDDWIGMARSLAFTQLDHHGGGEFFRFGDFELNRAKWPEGWESWGRIGRRLREAGIGSIFHTYAFFIDKRARYVTPVPDRRLDAFRTFTLAGDIGPDAAEIPIRESTARMSTVTGFFEHNSVVLHLDDELVTFSGFSAEAPWRFTGVKRGALGTRAAAHSAGTAARHLKECFGLFVPNPESSLFEEIAANHAEIVNRCEFDGIYLDAIDGSSILRGPDECWYWAGKFVFEIQKRLRRPVGMEMSAMWHHFWQYRTRWQAWDYPQRGQRRFVDLHAEALNGGLLLPLHLGWWNFQSFSPPQVEPTFPEIMETVGARLVGWDAGISLTGGVNREKLRSVPLFRRAVDILRTCEELRRSGEVGEAVRARLRQPGEGFALVTNRAGRVGFRPARSEAHTAAVAEPWTLAWAVTNAFAAQPLRFRIEALMSAPAADTNAIVLGDLAAADAGEWQHATAAGVAVRTERSTNAFAGGGAALLVGTNSGTVARQAAWARWQRRFAQPRDLKERQAVGLWVEGDGLGALLAIRQESPVHLAFGAVADRYLPVDFSGARFVTLIETESERWSDYVWGDGKALYNVYREAIDFGAVESVSIGLQNLPPGREVRCRIGPVLALPMVPARFRDVVLTVNGRAVACPAELTTGQWLEGEEGEEATVYSASGEALGRVSIGGRLPMLMPGRSELRFSCVPVDGPPPRVKVTVFTRGEEL